MNYQDSKKLPAVMENIREAMRFATSFAATMKLPPDRIMSLEMSVEEALVNIVKYAYPAAAGYFEVSCRLSPENKIIVEISDEGIPFDVLAKADPDVTLGVEERKVGGLGIYLMKKLMDEVSYRRENGRNILTLTIMRK
ncbi:MAG TPA: ATP-binding protein [Smithellaceae bacterium]|nr:ATP-binding protein [Smithellaceae bacterium]